MATRNALVGRRVELGRLAEALESARQGDGSVWLLAGDAGVARGVPQADVGVAQGE